MNFTINDSVVARVVAVIAILSMVAGLSAQPAHAVSEDVVIAPICQVTVVSADGDNNAVATYVHPTAWASISGATWIWSDALVVDTDVEQTETFTKTFNWSGGVLGASLKIAADNGYEVSLNGTVIGSGAKEDTNYSPVTTISGASVTSLIVPGVNTLSFTVTNDDDGNADVTATPQDNPAGFIYKLQVSGDTANCGELPPVDQCTNLDGMQARVPAGYDEDEKFCSPITVTEGTTEIAKCVDRTNLVNNGSFEEPAIGGGYSVVSAVANWISSSLDGFEIWRNLAGPAADGAQHLELDVNSPTTISQSIATVPGNVYQVTVDFSPRNGTGIADNKLEVAVNGVLGSVSADGTPYTGNVWSTHAFQFTATNVSSILELRDKGNGEGDSKGLGTLIDNVNVCLVQDNADIPDAVISGYKFNDRNADGVWDEDTEEPLEGWEIVLNQGDAEPRYATTDDEGRYSFPVKFGSYQVSETQQKGWEQTATIGTNVDGPICYINLGRDEEPSKSARIERRLSKGPVCIFGNHQIEERRSSGGGGTRVGDRTRSTPTGEVLGASTSTPTGVVLGDATTTMPVGAPNTGAGGTSPISVSLPTLVAILGHSARKSK